MNQLKRPPNFIYIMADDLGWGDLSCYGRPDYRTPHIDRLAETGVRLTDCYSGSATCSPTRISLMTGQYPARHPAGLPEPILPAVHGASVGLEPEFPALPRLLSEAGYRTSLIGKWHCGDEPDFGPLKSGFHEFVGLVSTGAGYFTYRDEHGTYLARDGLEELAERSGYLTHLLTDRACRFIEQNRDRPFYLSLHYNAPHWPWEAPYHEESAYQSPGGTGGGSIATFAAMMRELDSGVGQIVDLIETLRLDASTVIVLTSDNGGERYSYQYPLTGYIRLLREGGIRVPGIARWPGQIPAGQVSPQMAITMDWTATFLALASARPDDRYPADGVNLMPVLMGDASPYERTFYWRTPRESAVRKGPWKYLRNEVNQREHLFNLVKDIREYNSQEQAYPQILTELRSLFDEWQATVLPRPPIPVPGGGLPHVEFEIY